MFDLLELVSFDKLYVFDNESDNDGSGSGSAGMCASSFHSNESLGNVGESIGHVSGVGSIFVVGQKLSQLVKLLRWS